MSSRSLNKVQLIGNLTRDPELRYTPQGTAVCVFGLATNRSWTTENGEKREETEFHRVVAWNKLAELCAQLLFKGRKVYVEGRLQTRSWTAQDGGQRQATEVVIEEMIILDSRQATSTEEGAAEAAKTRPEPAVAEEPAIEDIPVVLPDEPTAQPSAPVVTDTAVKSNKKAKAVEENKADDKPAEDTDITADIPF